MRCGRELALAAAISGGCEGEDEGATEGAVQWQELADRPCPEDSVLTWENFGGPFFLDWCTGCHGSALPAGMRQNAPPGIDFDRLDLVRTYAPRIWRQAGDDNRRMPPSGPPPDEDRRRLGEWLACGAPSETDLAP